MISSIMVVMGINTKVTCFTSMQGIIIIIIITNTIITITKEVLKEAAAVNK
jgi:hypothetical protein